MTKNMITTAAEAATLDAGQWVQDADGTNWCLFQTHVMVHQWMWKAQKAQHYVALGGIPYPLHLCDLNEKDDYQCPHRDTQECGQCTRCGAVVSDTEKWRSMTFGAFALSPGAETGGDRG